MPAPVAAEAARTGEPARLVPASSAWTTRPDLADPFRIHQVGLRDDREPIVDAERVEELEVLDGLRPRPVVGGDDEHRGVDLAGADQHVADQPVVARDVDEVELDPIVERRWA